MLNIYHTLCGILCFPRFAELCRALQSFLSGSILFGYDLWTIKDYTDRITFLLGAHVSFLKLK